MPVKVFSVNADDMQLAIRSGGHYLDIFSGSIIPENDCLDFAKKNPFPDCIAIEDRFIEIPILKITIEDTIRNEFAAIEQEHLNCSGDEQLVSFDEFSNIDREVLEMDMFLAERRAETLAAWSWLESLNWIFQLDGGMRTLESPTFISQINEFGSMLDSRE